MKGENKVTDIIDFNKVKNKARDQDVNQFENYIYELYYSLSQGTITMSDLYHKINKYMEKNNISQEKFLNIQNEMLSRYGIDSEDIKNQLKTMGVDISSLETNIDYEAARKLQRIPKNANPIRLHNRCKITGRPKGYIRQFGLSRIQFREMASSGLIPGVKKASW